MSDGGMAVVGYAPGSVSYTAKEMFDRLEQAVKSVDHNVEFLTRQLDQERNVVEQRFSKLDTLRPLVDDLAAELATFRKVFMGFEARFQAHEATPTHAVLTAQWATLVADVEQFKLGSEVQKHLAEYIKETRDERVAAEERASGQRRWLIGLALTLSVPSVLTLALAGLRAVGMIP